MYNCGGRFLAICELNVKEKLPWPTWQISICKPTVTMNVESVFFSTSAGLQTQINIYSSNKTVSLLALWGVNAELMDIWLVCVCVLGEMSTYCVYIHDGDVSAEHFNYVYVHACPFGRGQRVLSVCHVVPAGCESHTGEDRWTKFSFPIVYNSDRQWEEQRARPYRALQRKI